MRTGDVRERMGGILSDVYIVDRDSVDVITRIGRHCIGDIASVSYGGGSARRDGSAGTRDRDDSMGRIGSKTYRDIEIRNYRIVVKNSLRSVIDSVRIDARDMISRIRRDREIGGSCGGNREGSARRDGSAGSGRGSDIERGSYSVCGTQKRKDASQEHDEYRG